MTPAELELARRRVYTWDISDRLPLRRAPQDLPLGRLQQIIVHRTDADSSTPESTAAFHTAAPPRGRGWSRIGYHYYVALDGTIYQTLKPSWEGCHCPPNRGRLGVVFVGRCDSPLTPSQELAFGPLLQQLSEAFAIPRAQVLGHREAMPGHTDCPGDAVLEALRAWRGA